jgi:hypothetical protein
VQNIIVRISVIARIVEPFEHHVKSRGDVSQFVGVVCKQVVFPRLPGVSRPDDGWQEDRGRRIDLARA